MENVCSFVFVLIFSATDLRLFFHLGKFSVFFLFCSLISYAYDIEYRYVSGTLSEICLKDGNDHKNTVWTESQIDINFTLYMKWEQIWKPSIHVNRTIVKYM